MSNPIRIKPRFLALPLISALAACSNDVVDLGGGTVSQSVEYGSRCAESAIVDGDVHISDQQQLDALLGCEEIRGDLTVDMFEDTDLASLADLRSVEGTFFLGSFPEFPDDLTEESIAAWQIEYERVIAIADAGWLTSLAGVESLERVGGLVLSRISAPTLEAFASLRLVTSDTDAALAGYLAIASSYNLVDLRGLENVRGFRVLEISDNFALESLDGLTVGSALDDLTLQNDLALTDIDALAPLRNVLFDIFIYGTAIPNVDAFANLEQASRGLALSGNPELTDADGLNGLQSVEYLVFEDCPKLERLPEFSNLVSIDAFKAMRNASLQSISLNFPNLYAVNIVDNVDVPLSASVIEIGDNPELESLAFVAGFRTAELVSIYRNESLAQLDLGSLERLDRLDIRGNPALTALDLGSLQTVDSLSVLGNTSLTTTELRSVRTFESEFILNADDPPPAP